MSPNNSILYLGLIPRIFYFRFLTPNLPFLRLKLSGDKVDGQSGLNWTVKSDRKWTVIYCSRLLCFGSVQFFSSILFDRLVWRKIVQFRRKIIFQMILCCKEFLRSLQLSNFAQYFPTTLLVNLIHSRLDFLSGEIKNGSRIK